jgi:RNA polymerase sigma-70 factor (ECF subfamily)
MNEKKFLTDQFGAKRGHLRSVAYRMLGSRTEAEDAVQEAWLRLNRSDMNDVANLGGWLTTVVARVCRDMLRSRKSRREDTFDAAMPERISADDAASDPAHEIEMADSVGLALLVVLQTLAPAERVAFVLHDMFDLPFDEIAAVVGRSPEAARQLASRARRRVQGTDARPQVDRARQREVVDAFLAAARGGDFEALLAVLDPDVVFRSDRMAVQLGGAAELRGAAAVANNFKGRAQSALPALLGDGLGLAVVVDGKLKVALRLTIADGRITAIDAVAEPDSLDALGLTVLRD